jgi:hypothetical protein
MNPAQRRAIIDQRVVYVRRVIPLVQEHFMRLFRTLDDINGHYPVKVTHPISQGLDLLETHLRTILRHHAKKSQSYYIELLAFHLALAFAKTPEEAYRDLMNAIIRSFVNEADYDSADEFIHLLTCL